MITRRLAHGLLIAAFCCTAHAAAPVLDYLNPTGAQRGSTLTVIAGDKAAQVWTDSPEIKVEPGASNGSFTFKISPNCPTGPHLIRLYNADGASPPRIFIIGDQKEIAESEPNDDLSKIKAPLSLPITINGVLEKPGDIDAFAFHLDAGQCLAASVLARRLGAPMDPMLHLYDQSGNELAFSHDGLGLDPLLIYHAKASGAYIIRISAFAFPPAADVKLTGAKNDIYRLSLTTGPFPRTTWPAGIQRGQKKTLQLLNLCGENSNVEIDATKSRPTDDRLFIPIPTAESRLRVELNDGSELLESDISQSTSLTAPFAINGRIASAGEEDHYQFTATKNQKLILSLRAGSLGSSLDALLRLEDSSKKELLRNDDSIGDDDLRLEWTPPADGKYSIFVSDMKRQGGANPIYRLFVEKPQPAITAAVSGHEFTVKAGKSIPIKLTTNRLNGHSGNLVALAADFPALITSTTAPIPEKGGEITITLTATPDAKAFSGPIRLLLLGTEPDHPSLHPATFDLGKDSLIPSTDSIWLTVQPPPPATQPSTKPASQPTSAK